MELTVDQVLALAPDSSAAAAARTVDRPAIWQNLGQDPAALWGECRGSAVYQVRVDRRDFTVKCTCPSRKLPCKHGLGLMLLAAGRPGLLPNAEPPDWVASWLARRGGGAARRDEPVRPHDAVPERRSQGAEAMTSRKAERRLARVRQGLDTFDLWLDDLMRSGLAGLEARPESFWKATAARLVDAQAPGLAARVRRLPEIPHASPDWPERLLSTLGRLALLSYAGRRLDALDPALQADVRSAIGWSLSQDEVIASGEVVRDDWLVLGQSDTLEEQLRARSTWLVGARTGRGALVLQFAHGNAPFESQFVPGTRQEAELAFWPSAWPQRAFVRFRTGEPKPIRARLPGLETVTAFLDDVARALAHQPWLERFSAALCGVVPLRNEPDGWFIRDREGAALPLSRGEHWQLLAISGGRPVDLAGEWDGEAIRPLGVVVDDVFHPLGAES